MRALANTISIAPLPVAAQAAGVPLAPSFVIAMSLSLHQRLLHESAGVAPPLPRGLRLPWRDSATQQLDVLEAANRRLSANRIGGNGLWIGLVALALLVALATSSWQPAPRVQPPAAVAAAAPALLPLPVVGTVLPQPLPIAQPESPAAPPPALALIDEAARQQAARARALAEARRQAARVAQERVLAEKDALRASERRQAERPVDAPPARVEALAPAAKPVAHAAPRAGVRESCSGAGFFGQPLCHSRECRKPENAGDAVCVQLREFEQARLRTDR